MAATGNVELAPEDAGRLRRSFGKGWFNIRLFVRSMRDRRTGWLVRIFFPFFATIVWFALWVAYIVFPEWIVFLPINFLVPGLGTYISGMFATPIEDYLVAPFVVAPIACYLTMKYFYLDGGLFPDEVIRDQSRLLRGEARIEATYETRLRYWRLRRDMIQTRIERNTNDNGNDIDVVEGEVVREPRLLIDSRARRLREERAQRERKREWREKTKGTRRTWHR